MSTSAILNGLLVEYLVMIVNLPKGKEFEAMPWRGLELSSNRSIASEILTHCTLISESSASQTL